ncbi:SDR family NAD(P)-dependent oxidoreductase [Nocardia bhagyanarayanae]|uniref:NAD(P)-dependent dehydrogenase (Short-subunit alcohol dehydrogenase family) n=1 Tax=Nocardia bhagyanarayanae TaxID=1215925 RepID=A0A543FDR6_9NOCA|nr:SDR family NAD(P)-dependent oxidoreductase [Nocardia bhagyanarayanae]TQM32035.1 NAD(P)-dependent dehydrogenase (short-subunit alcohol dehydrogenase family) [Nocardia bhagyanarayanae]
MTDVSPFDLGGHVAVVTGGNSGIGLGFARGLARAGADVCIVGRNAERNAAAAAELSEFGGRVLPLVCDVAEEQQIVDTVARAAAELGRIDSCFVNAGVAQGMTPFLDTDLAEFRRVTSVNLDGAFVTLREAAKVMVAQGAGGSLVATASLAARQGVPRGQSYAASKAGIIAVINSIAVELGKHGIRANAVLPGWIDTPMTEHIFAWHRFRERVQPRIPVRRWGSPGDFEAVAVYLASPASAYHTGDTLLIDGGYSMF